ncbi:MAG TPA: carbamoyl-phosphate synthase large subunit, partial [Phycisphaerae bacterium]
REIGVETGGSNIQFAVHPQTGRQVAIEMNPRVSRSSALASKATGYPIARIAAKLAVGYTLDELPNDITKKTPASFEPTIDYCVVKIPRWTFEKFPDADETLGTQMKSVGEAMAIGRTFKEAFQKAIRSMEIKRFGYGLDANDQWLAAQREGSGLRVQNVASPLVGGAIGRAPGTRPDATDSGMSPAIGGSTAAEAPPDTEEEHAKLWPIPADVLHDKLARPSQGRPYYIRYALKMGWNVEQICDLTKIDPWFIENMRELVEFEPELCARDVRAASARPACEGRGEPVLAHASATEVASHRRAAQARRVRPGSATATATATLPDSAGDPEAVLQDITQRSLVHGYSDVQRATAWATDRDTARRLHAGPAYKLVDTCAAEFEAYTPYYYSSYEMPLLRIDGASGGSRAVLQRVEDEARISERPKIIVLGGGPNRIGQGIEFDYCCCHAAFTAREAGYEAVMINSNPETVSTDYDTSDLLFFEPLTHEDVLNIIERLNGGPLLTTPRLQGRVKGVVVQFGGQTPLNLAASLQEAGAPIIGTSPEMIHLAEDREEFARILRELSLLQPPSGIALNLREARQIAQRIGYPVLVRPSYVLGGRAMQVCNNDDDLTRYMEQAVQATDRSVFGDDKNPILVDKFLTDAIEVDVDAVADFGQERGDGDGRRRRCVVCGVMEHIEEAGIHSGDSTCTLPPYSLGPLVIDELKRSTERLARRLKVCGLMNVQFAIQNRTIYVLEVNPRASRTVPFVAKATGIPWAEVATRVMLGQSLDEILSAYGIDDAPWPQHVSIKAPVFPFTRFPGVDVILGPEMRSTGEVMAIDRSFGLAFAKAQIATGLSLPMRGNVLVSVNDADKPRIIPIARDLHEMGFKIFSTVGTRAALAEVFIPATLVSKQRDESAPFLKDLIDEGTLHLLINTPIRHGRASDEGRWRAAAAQRRIPIITTLAGARAAIEAIRTLRRAPAEEELAALGVRPLQSYFTASGAESRRGGSAT